MLELRGARCDYILRKRCGHAHDGTRAVTSAHVLGNMAQAPALQSSGFSFPCLETGEVDTAPDGVVDLSATATASAGGERTSGPPVACKPSGNVGRPAICASGGSIMRVMTTHGTA